jgi:hypothetical protein
MSLRGSWLFWFGLSVIVCGTFPVVLGASPVLGIEFAAVGYLLVLFSMYRVGVRMYARGGVITKQKAPWAYRASFLLLSVFGFGALCIALTTESLGGSHSCDTAWCQIKLLTMAISGLISLLLIASSTVAAVIGIVIWMVAAARGHGQSSKRMR